MRRAAARVATVLAIGSAVAFALSAARAATAPSAPSGPRVGEPAPALGELLWLKGEPIRAFEPGKVYIIDIWAPWCGPCLGGMGHLTRMEQQERARGLRVLGVTGPDDYGSTLEGAKRAVAEKGKDLGYAVAWDDGGRMYRTWMSIESGAGWPWSFVVDRQGRVAYVGHPERLDAVVEQVLSGTYDLAAAAARYRQRVEGLEVAARFYDAYSHEKWRDAAGLYDQLLAADAQIAGDFAAHEYKLLAFRLRDAAAAKAFGRRALASLLADRPGSLLDLARLIVDPKLDLAPRDLALALDLARRAQALEPGNEAARDLVRKLEAESGGGAE